jgi:multiple sugar transport system ATP-binding protein
MGRAIVREPAAFLMDEPLSNLDAKLRVQMRGDIRQLQSRLGTTTVYVTHDQVEAMTMGDRVAVIRKGVLQQAAPPQELYERPDNLFVAGFIGSPAMNLLSANVVQADGGLAVDVGRDRLALAPGALAAYPQVASKVGETVVMGIRPEHFDDAAGSDLPASQRITVTTTLVEAMGSEIFLHFELPVPPPETEDTRELKEDVDEAAVEALAEEGSTPITARLEPTTRAQLGQPIELAVDTGKAHFFEPESGRALR